MVLSVLQSQFSFLVHVLWVCVSVTANVSSTAGNSLKLHCDFLGFQQPSLLAHQVWSPKPCEIIKCDYQDLAITKTIIFQVFSAHLCFNVTMTEVIWTVRLEFCPTVRERLLQSIFWRGVQHLLLDGNIWWNPVTINQKTNELHQCPLQPELILMPCDLSCMNIIHIRPSNTQVIKSQVKSYKAVYSDILQTL